MSHSDICAFSLEIFVGGALGLFEKGDSLNFGSSARRLDVYGKDIENGADISKPVG